MKSNARSKAIVLVHGAFADGSGWEAVYQKLAKDGYNVGVVQHSTVSLAGDVAATRAVIAKQQEPVILVGHSYGGVVITEAGSDPRVAGLVYVSAFVPDKGESAVSLSANPPPGAPQPPIMPPQDGFVVLDEDKFPAAFAGDVDPQKAAFMAAAQLPLGVAALGGAVTAAAWRTKPSWYLVTTQDKMVPPDAQRSMAKRAGSKVQEVAGSHASYISHPDAVSALIENAAES